VKPPEPISVPETPPVPEAAPPASETPAATEAPAPPAHVPPARPLVPPVPLAAPRTVVGPAELFDREAAARRGGDYGRAVDLDRDLEARYPTSREAQVSRAIMGRLLLDRGDPAGALAKFQDYLAAGSGQLAEEAMVGRATALERLGKPEEAARAWGALVAAFPDSPYAAHARARLEGANGL
jgi:TolA-binding protein